MELKFTNYEFKEKKISFEIEKGTIYGITGQNSKELLEIIALNKLNKGILTINNEKVTKDNINEYRRRISLIGQDLETSQHKLLNIMIDHIKRHNLTIKDPIKKIKDSLKIVELPEDILSRNIETISSSEKKLFQLALSLLSNPDIIILDEPIKCLDKSNEKKLIMLLQRLKEQFSKTIIIYSDDSNTLYKYTSNMLFIKNNDILLSGPTNELYLRVDFLKRNKFDIPDIIEFTYLAKKKKQVKIDYHKDVRDIIKDIYKHI